MRRRFRMARLRRSGARIALLILVASGLAWELGALSTERLGRAIVSVFATTTAFAGLVVAGLLGFACVKDFLDSRQRQPERVRHESSREV